jgi:hypothetical protein
MYIEHDNMIFRGEVSSVTKMPRMVEAIVNGKWQDVSSKTLMDAGFYGTEMTEEEAKAFQGKDWPADDPAAPAAAPAPKAAPPPS